MPLSEIGKNKEELDQDALHIPPLEILPVETPGLKRARVIKNVRLDSMLELFREADTGSGQVHPSKLAPVFNWPTEETHQDEILVSIVSNLHSYDVYTLRIRLWKLGIDAEDFDQLKLSKEKSEELASYMKTFTLPLIKQIYGKTGSDIKDVSQLIGMFSSPDKGEALKNLKIMASKLKIGLADVPKFLEDYGDVFMSLAYYKNCLDNLIPKVMAYNDSTEELKENYQLKNDRRLMKCVQFIGDHLSDVTASITGRFESFDRHSEALWEDITAESFAKVKTMIQGHYVTVGEVLCGLSVKMNSWHDQFGKGGGLVAKGDFISSEMRQGIERIVEIEKSAPKISDV